MSLMILVLIIVLLIMRTNYELSHCSKGLNELSHLIFTALWYKLSYHAYFFR